jgi:NADH-quinone oxidoreductase subunit N
VGGFKEKLRSFADYQGLAMRRPVLAALLALFLLSLLGIPFTGGFFGKFYVFSAAIQAGQVWLAVIGLLNSGVACFYYLRLLSTVYTRPQESAAAPLSPASTPAISVPAGIGLALTAAATLLLGILPSHILRMATYASSGLRTPSAIALPAPPTGSKVPLPSPPQ